MFNKQPKNYFDEWRKTMNTKREDYGVAYDALDQHDLRGESLHHERMGHARQALHEGKARRYVLKRIGLIGSSHMMGWGIGDAEVCDVLAGRAP